jgi:transformation/transcription domain-associated protein
MVEFNTHGGSGQQYQKHKVMSEKDEHTPAPRQLTTPHSVHIQEICETWKLRSPNEWEPIQWWSQVLTWRNQVTNASI